MRIVVVSDSHRNYIALNEIYHKHSEAGMFIHLGDGEEEFRVLAEKNPDHRAKLSVRGNNDRGSASELIRCIKLEGAKILYTHGHLLGVNNGLAALEGFARASKSNVVLFGHTHRAMTAYQKGVHFLNPGSVSQPRDGAPSYGIVDLTEQGIRCFIVRRGTAEGGWRE